MEPDAPQLECHLSDLEAAAGPAITILRDRLPLYRVLVSPLNPPRTATGTHAVEDGYIAIFNQIQELCDETPIEFLKREILKLAMVRDVIPV